MPTTPSDIFTTFRTICSTVWTDVVHTGNVHVWDGEHVERTSIESLELPYAVITVSEWRRAAFALDLDDFRCVVQLIYVAKQEGKSTSIRDKLRDMQVYLDSLTRLTDVTIGQIERVEMLATSNSLPFNEMLADRRHNVRAGGIAVSLRCEEWAT